VNRKRLLITCVGLWLAAFGIRVLSWQDNRLDAGKVEWVIAAEYREAGTLISQGEISSYLHNLYFMTHPPGYAIFLATIFKVIGNSETTVRMVQIACDAGAVVLVFLIATELLSSCTAIIAGLIVAVSPQLAYYPSLLLPDSLSVLPILLGIYCLAIARRHPRISLLFLAGAFVGISCWLRANALLMAPFLVPITPLLFKRGQRFAYSGALLLGTVLVIAPVTIKNLIVWHRVIPLSLGAGQKLLEGVAEYDRDNTLGIPKTDVGIVLQEAELQNRPEYARGLFTGDGIERDRARLTRGLSVIRAHPLWYLGVMTRRAASFLKLARVPLVSAQPTFSHSLRPQQDGDTVKLLSPAVLMETASNASSANAAALPEDVTTLQLIGDDSKYGVCFRSKPINVSKDSDYTLTVPLKLEAGRLLVSVTSADQKSHLSTTVVDPLEAVAPEAQPVQVVSLPLATGNDDSIRLVLSNGGAKARAQLGTVKFVEYGPTSYLRTRYPRMLIHVLQKAFVTACMLPLALVGLALLIRARRWQSLALLLIVPAYYLTLQSALHTERRYVIAIHYFLFMLVAISVSFIAGPVVAWSGRRLGWKTESLSL